MKFNGIVVLVYGILVMLGGLIGYLMADSLPSLIMGSLFGALLIAGGMAIMRKSFIGYMLSLICSSILTLFFSWRFYQTGIYFPPGSLALLSFLVVLLLASSRIKKGSTGIR